MQHPYQEFVDTELWNTLWETVDELVENQDIEEMTSREYIVGHLCLKLQQMKKMNKTNNTRY